MDYRYPGLEIADPEAEGTGGPAVFLTPVGLRPPFLRKTAPVTFEPFPFFRSHIIDKHTQIKELVRGSVEETLNELLEKEAESRHRRRAMNAARPVRATAADTMTGTEPRHDLRRHQAPYATAQGRVL